MLFRLEIISQAELPRHNFDEANKHVYQTWAGLIKSVWSDKKEDQSQQRADW